MADGYADQSRFTDPARMSHLVEALPRDIAVLQRIARGPVIHYRADDRAALGIPPERLAEIDSRYAETMLARLIELSDVPLSTSREPVQRLVGCCRDFTVLFLSMARSVGIPSRARVGFARYLVRGVHVDHEVAEVWDDAANRWRLVDAALDEAHADPDDGARVDPLDLPRDRFLVAGKAWRLCRDGNADPGGFVVDSALEEPATRGWPYLCHNVVHDVAALLKTELILWDSWGLAEEAELGEPELELLDRAARPHDGADDRSERVAASLQAESVGLRVPATVVSYDPLGGEPRTVALL